MKQFLCKTCGQSLTKQGDNYICSYCGNIWVDDFADNNKVERDLAWHEFNKGDFEQATEIFDKVLLKNSNDHEAYWGKALSLNAILYVDEGPYKSVPTCNNISESSFINSNEVQKAISLAPSEVAESYKKQSDYIERVRLEWLKKASQEPEYDVFISFKDSDRENGIERTKDSIDAQDLYNILTAEGLNVFFSRVSLRNKVSEQYEPYIYNAINTAKVMIVFGEKVEYFSAPWIKNEWRRYLSRVESGEKHKNSLIVVYKDIEVGKLPRVLSSKQCMNYDDVTFSLTLVRHIKSIVEAHEQNKRIGRVEIKGGQIAKKASAINVNQIKTRELGANSVQTSINDAQKLSLVDTYLAENMFEEANKLLKEVLVENPTSGLAIFKSLQIKYKKNAPTSIDNVDIALLEKAIINCNKEGASSILNHLYGVNLADNFAEALLKVILPFEYEGRQKQIEKAFDSAIKQHNYKAFCLLLKTLNSNEVDRYITYNLAFVEGCTSEDKIIECLNNVVLVDNGNCKALKQLFKLNLFYKQDSVKSIEIFEQLLKYSKNPESEIAETINLLNDNFKPSYCEVIKKVLRYSTSDISEYKKTILDTVQKAIYNKNFELAQQLISVITDENEQDADIYWKICLIKTKSTTSENIVNSDIALNSLPEFQRYLLLASELYRKRGLDIVKRQTVAIEERRKSAQESEAELKAYTLIGQLQKMDKIGGQVNQARLNALTSEVNTLSTLKNNWHSTSNQIHLLRSQIADGKKELEEKINRKKGLGLFAIKEKGELTREIKIIESTIASNERQISELAAKIAGFNSYEQLCNKYEDAKSELHSLSEQLSSAQIREMLSRSTIGKRLLNGYDQFKNTKVGSVVHFGYYPQMSSGAKAPIEWLVLDVQGGKALLLAKQGIDCKPYHDSNNIITWQNCYVRRWLNNEFIKTAFSADEMTRVLTVNLPADRNPSFTTNVGNPTQDKVFLLSILEVRKYLNSNASRVCRATSYAVNNGATSGSAFWLLRTPGNYGANASYVSQDGSISEKGYFVNMTNRAIRPAIWVELDEVKLGGARLAEKITNNN